MNWLAAINAFLAQEARCTRPALSFYLDGQALGFLSNETALAILAHCPGQAHWDGQALRLALAAGDYAGRSQELQALALALRAQGLAPGWRNEAMVLHDPQGQPYAELERTLFRVLGLETRSVHLNAWVAQAEGACLWVARRSASKSVDPHLYDNLVGGGVSAGENLTTALAREAWEEAGLLQTRPLRPLQCLYIARPMCHGLQREQVNVYERWLKPGFQPRNQDGEVASQECLPLEQALARLLAGQFTRDAALVILDGLCRLRFFGQQTPAISAALQAYGLYTRLP